MLIEAMLASAAHRPDAPMLLDRLDSATQLGCCEVSHWANLVVAHLRELAGDRAAALRAVRRERWYFPPEYLSTSLCEEGRLAALSGDREGAITAYRHFLALQANPEPERKAGVDSVRSALERLETRRHD